MRDSGIEEARQQREAGGFGSHREKGRDGNWRAFIDVGRPHMKWHRRDFVTHPGEDQHQRDKHGQHGHVACGRKRAIDHAEVERACDAVDPAHPVDHRARGDAAVDEVLEGGLLRTAIVLEKAGQHVGSKAHEFERQIRHQEVGRGRHQEHPERARKQQRIVFALVAVAHLLGAHRHPYRDDGGQRDQRTEENREGIEDEHAVEEPCAREAWLQRNQEERGGRDDEREITEEGFVAYHEIEQHHDEDARGEEALRVEVLEACEVVQVHACFRKARSMERDGGGGVGVQHDLVQMHERGVEQRKDRVRIDAEDEDDDREWNERKRLAQAQIGERLVLLVKRAQVNALETPEQVAGGQNRGARAEDRHDRMRLPCADQHEHFGDEGGEARQTHPGKKREAGNPCVHRHLMRESAEAIDLAMMSAVVNHTDQDEEHRRDRAVVEHLEDRAVDSDRRERRHPEHHVTHVANRRIRDELFVVLLRHRAECAVDDVDGADTTQEEPREFMACGGENRIVDAQDAVGAHFEQDAGEDDADRGGSFDVRVGKPRVEWEGRDFDRKADEQREPYDALKIHRVMARLRCELGHVEGGICPVVVQAEHREQYQDRAEQGVEEKLDGGVLAPRATPYADEEVHRQQHHFPENVEEEKIERYEDAHHPGVEQHQERVVALLGAVDTETREDRDEADERSQQHHRDADAVDAHEVIDVVGADPRIALDELERSRGGVEVGVEPRRDYELRHSGGGGDPFVRALERTRTKEDENYPDERDEGNQCKRMRHLFFQ